MSKVVEDTAVAPQTQPVEHVWFSKAAVDVLAERRRQVEAEGWTPEHDDTHDQGEMAFAAVAYLMAVVNPNGARSWWPSWSWSSEWFKPGAVRRMLVKAAALIVAEIERLDRAVHSHKS